MPVHVHVPVLYQCSRCLPSNKGVQIRGLISEGCDEQMFSKVSAPEARLSIPTMIEDSRVVIGVARDAAFGFYYRRCDLPRALIGNRFLVKNKDALDPILIETSVPCRSNLQKLEEAGARLVFFSPLSDQLLPPGMSGLYLGGGFPEKHAKALAANRPMRVAIKAFAASGGAVYAECGGLLYLSQSVQPVDDLLPAPMGAHSLGTLAVFNISKSEELCSISIHISCERLACNVCALFLQWVSFLSAP